MGDEQYTTGELGRRIDALQQMLDARVGRLEYDAELRGLGRQLADLQRDVADERISREQEVRDLKQQLKDERAARASERSSWRGVLWTSLLPTVAVVIGVLVQLWLSGGGHR